MIAQVTLLSASPVSLQLKRIRAFRCIRAPAQQESVEAIFEWEILH
jgi:hypothetical protein